jgi:hypothetical protein
VAACGQFLHSRKTSTPGQRDNLWSADLVNRGGEHGRIGGLGVPAVASYLVPDSGAVRNATVVNLGEIP